MEIYVKKSSIFFLSQVFD